jgi:CrcB protein
VVIAVLVGLAAGVRAVARHVTDLVVQAQHDSVFPVGTFTINFIGSLLLGLITGLGLHHGLSTGPVVVVVVVLSAGFCGGCTTWSTFGYETVALAESGALLEAVGNIAASLAAGLAAAAAGFGVALL